jgi:hypothetical protein
MESRAAPGVCASSPGVTAGRDGAFEGNTPMSEQSDRGFPEKPFLIKTYVSEQEIFSSGAIVVRDLDSIQFKLQSQIDSHPYEILIKFTRIENNESGVSWSSSLIRTEITFTNFDSPSGLTTYAPLPVGFFRGKPLLLDVVIYTLGNDLRLKPPKLFCYTLRAGGQS